MSQYNKLLHVRYVDGTFLLVKERDMELIHKLLSSFHKSIIITIDHFPDAKVHFLDIQIDENHRGIYYKPTHTEQYTHFHSQTPWLIKTA